MEIITEMTIKYYNPNFGSEAEVQLIFDEEQEYSVRMEGEFYFETLEDFESFYRETVNKFHKIKNNEI